MHKTLNILVTRPQHQADNISYLLDNIGAIVYRFPTIAITPLYPSITPSINTKTRLIFTSTNAVTYGLKYLEKVAPLLLQHCPLFAIGTKTTQKLLDYGMTVSEQPIAPFNSEALLALPSFHPTQICNKSVLIIKGEGGRTALQETLIARKAVVNSLSVYQRNKSTPDIEQIIKLRNINIDIIMLTSVESTHNLITLLAHQNIAWLSKAQLLLGSARIADEVTKLGLTNPYWIANNPSDKAMLTTLTQELESIYL